MTYLYVLEKATHYDSQLQQYRQIITINKNPDGPLKSIVKQIHNPPLSPFQYPPPQVCRPPNCIYAITNNNGRLMCINELPNLFQFLISNGYTIDYQLSKLMEKSQVKLNNTLICYILYNK